MSVISSLNDATDEAVAKIEELEEQLEEKTNDCEKLVNRENVR